MNWVVEGAKQGGGCRGQKTTMPVVVLALRDA